MEKQVSPKTLTDERAQETANSAADERYSLEELQANLYPKMGREVPITGHTISMVPTGATA